MALRKMPFESPTHLPYAAMLKSKKIKVDFFKSRSETKCLELLAKNQCHIHPMLLTKTTHLNGRQTAASSTTVVPFDRVNEI